MRKSRSMSRVRLAALLGAGALAASFAVAWGTARVLAGTPVTLYVNPVGTSSSCTSPGTGACPTIQEGITAAEGQTASDVTVMVAADTYDEDDTIDDPIGDTLTLHGAGAATTIVNGGATTTVITITGGAVAINGLTVTNGSGTQLTGGGVDISAGAVVTMTDDNISDNASLEDGGGVFNAGTVTLTDDTISNNTVAVGSALGFGGGLYDDSGAVATLTNDTVSSNGSDGFVFAQGGGIYNSNLATLTLTDDTISNNTAESDGLGVAGGILNDGTAVITNNTIFDDSTNGVGGGLYNVNGTATLTDDTLAQDSASAGYGGGIWMGNGSVTLANSIVDAAECAGNAGVTDDGYNVEDDDSCFGTDAKSVENSATINLASSLAANASSGPETLAIGPNSSAYKEVPLANCTVSTDERGDSRPGVPGVNCDAGAYEFQQSPTAISTTANPNAAALDTTLQDSATLSDTTSFDGTGTITFNLYGPGANANCGTPPIYTETRTGITTDGPYSTTAGFLATEVGTYEWTASFSGDGNNAPANTLCGAEPVVITTGSPITEIATQASTCTQFAHNTAHTQSSVTYALKNGKIKSVTPASFTYWVKVTSSGGTQTLAVTESASETSRLFLVSASGSSAYNSTCGAVPITLTQSGGSITVKFNGGTAGAVFYIELKASTSAVVGEAKPAPGATVTYTFSAPSSGGGPRKISLET